MKTKQCDVLVVGAGPAGTSAAYTAVGTGAEVVVVERRSSVGLPVQCAEYIPAQLLEKVGQERGFVVQRLRGMRTILPDGEVKEIRYLASDVWWRIIANSGNVLGPFPARIEERSGMSSINVV